MESVSWAYWSQSENASVFSKLSHVDFEQVDDYQHFRQPSLGGRALGGQQRAGWSQGSPFVAFSLGPVSRVSLCRNRAWSRGAVNTIFSAARSPTSLPICCMNATLCGFETRPVYIPQIWPLSPVSAIAFLLPLLHCYSAGLHSVFPPLKPTSHHHLATSRSSPGILWGFGHLVWRFSFHAVPLTCLGPWWLNTEAAISSLEGWNLHKTSGGCAPIYYWVLVLSS